MENIKLENKPELLVRAREILDLLSRGDIENPDTPDFNLRTVLNLPSGRFIAGEGLCSNLGLAEYGKVKGILASLAKKFDWHSGFEEYPVEGADEYHLSRNKYTGENRIKRMQLLQGFIDYLENGNG